MPSTLDISIEGIPDGSFMTVLDQADGTRIQRGSIVYTDEAMSVTLPIDGGITVKGYVDDSLNPSSNGAYLEGVTVGGVIFTPLSLFQSGEQGAWYDPSDLSTLFQDAAGTTPVTADGEPVGLMTDKSGNGNDVSQAVAAARPTYKTDGTLHWLEFDGVDDWLLTTVNFGLSLNSAVFASVAFRNDGTDDDYTTLFSQHHGTPLGAFSLVVGGSYSGTQGDARLGTDVWTPAGIYGGTTLAQSVDFVGTWMLDDWAAHFTTGAALYVNGVSETLATFSPTLVPLTLTNAPLYIGAFGPNLIGSRLNGRWYGGVIIRDNVGTQDERAGLESYLASKSGVTL